MRKAGQAVLLALILLGLGLWPLTATAPMEHTFGPACGMPVIDGVIRPGEWSAASTRTVQMVRPSGGEPFTVNIHVMNGARYLYMAIAINDDEFTTAAQWLPQGDSFRIDFDNDCSGSIYTVGDNVLNVSAGLPQFWDGFLLVGTSSSQDALHGGRTDGDGAASRVGDHNHFELRHPLCSGDTLDFCLRPGDSVGFRLEYLDAQADGSFGGSQFYPGVSADSVAEIRIGLCAAPDYAVHVPLARR